MGWEVNNLLDAYAVLEAFAAAEPDGGPAFGWLPRLARARLLAHLTAGKRAAERALAAPESGPACASIAQAARELRGAIVLLQEWHVSQPGASAPET